MRDRDAGPSDRGEKPLYRRDAVRGQRERRRARPAGPQRPRDESRFERLAAGRGVRLLTAGLGVLLLVLAVASAVHGARGRQVADLDRRLSATAETRAAAATEYFERSVSLTLLLAHDSAFARATAAVPGSPAAQSAARDAGSAMAYLEALYPGRISEACLIDATGTEIARVTRGAVAPASELSDEEAEAVFFAPTMLLPQGAVHQTRPYLSPDTDQWVVANATPLFTPDGRRWGMVHFEVALDGFRMKDSGEGAAQTVWIVERDTGRIVLDSERPLGASEPGRPAPAWLSGALLDGSTGSAPGGRRVATAVVSSQGENANTWLVVASAPPEPIGLSDAISPSSVGSALAALLLLGLTALSVRASHARVRLASLSDELTGLPNRRRLSAHLERALARARRTGDTVAVLLIDLDRFKEVNDTLGHHYGDELLQEVGRRLSTSFRGSDTVARLGGDEFAVLLPDAADEAAAVQAARRCLAVLREPFAVEGISLEVEASVGVGIAPGHAEDAHGLMRVADVAMYDAKERKVGVVVYDPNLDVNTPGRLALLGDLRRALARDELELHYQPKLVIGEDEVRSVEALVRWQHPTRGLLPPAEFVPAAEGTGLIIPLTVRTLEIAIAQASLWRRRDGRDIQVAVNLSARCLMELTFPDLVMRLLAGHGLPPRLLRLEITESTIMMDPTRALAVLSRLQDDGVSLSIDDFGTGYSSMSYLKRLPVDELKIDRSFVMDMLASTSDGVLVRSSIDLGHNLGLSVVAEGVEDAETLDALRALGCDVVQGYHLGRPMTVTAFDAWVEGREAGRQDAAVEPSGPISTA